MFIWHCLTDLCTWGAARPLLVCWREASPLSAPRGCPGGPTLTARAGSPPATLPGHAPRRSGPASGALGSSPPVGSPHCLESLPPVRTSATITPHWIGHSLIGQLFIGKALLLCTMLQTSIKKRLPTIFWPGTHSSEKGWANWAVPDEILYLVSKWLKL